MTLLHTSCILG